MPEFDLLVIGAGASGMSAAVKAKNCGIESILLVDSRDYLGGILPQCIHDGFTNEMTGPEYAEVLINEIRHAPEITVMLSTCVTKITRDKVAVMSTKSGMISVKFRELILSTGCTERTLFELGISGSRCEGIYYAGQAQEMINLMHADIGDDAVLIGCGDLGMIMARRLALHGKKVVAVIEKNGTYGGMARNYRSCIEKYNIPVVFNTEVEAVNGDENVQSVSLTNGDTLRCKTVIIAAGLKCERTLINGFDNVPEWIHPAGNCKEVFSMVESAVKQSKDAAVIAAERIKND